MAFEYSGHKGTTLAPVQENFLDTIENLPSPFRGVSNLKDLRTISGVSVIVANRRYLIRYLEKFVENFGRRSEQFFYGGDDSKSYHANQGEIGDRLRWAKEQLKKAKESGQNTVPLLGLYSRKLNWYTGKAPVVYLFADNINDYARIKACNADNVFGYVFIHEMMHAYYDSFNNVGYPAIGTLEEAFAEFGMLSFISKSFGLCDFLDDAKDHVLSKIESGPREYGFGYEMFARTGDDAPEMIERYKDISNWINYPVLKAAGINYYNSINAYQSNPNEGNADKCYDDVLEILDLELTEPGSPIQPRIKSAALRSSISSSTSHTSPTFPRKRVRYEIIEMASGKVIESNLSMAKVPLIVLMDFCAKNKRIVFSDLQRIFGTIRPYAPSNMSIIVHKFDIDDYITRSADKKSRYHNRPVILWSGDMVFVSSQWTSDGNFPKFLEIVKRLGYEIRPIL